MKKITLLLLSILPTLGFCQNLLDTDWKFKTGDSPEYSRVSFDDKDWTTIEAGTVWELQGFKTYDGIAWYRKGFDIPSSLKKEAEKNGGLLLDLGKMDDAGEIYWNGKIILTNGKFPPDYEIAYDKPARVGIPAGEVNWGGRNTDCRQGL